MSKATVKIPVTRAKLIRRLSASSVVTSMHSSAVTSMQSNVVTSSLRRCYPASLRRFNPASLCRDYYCQKNRSFYKHLFALQRLINISVVVMGQSLRYKTDKAGIRF